MGSKAAGGRHGADTVAENVPLVRCTLQVTLFVIGGLVQNGGIGFHQPHLRSKGGKIGFGVC